MFTLILETGLHIRQIQLLFPVVINKPHDDLASSKVHKIRCSLSLISVWNLFPVHDKVKGQANNQRVSSEHMGVCHECWLGKACGPPWLTVTGPSVLSIYVSRHTTPSSTHPSTRPLLFPCIPPSGEIHWSIKFRSHSLKSPLPFSLSSFSLPC